MEVTLVTVRKLQIAFDSAWKRIRGGHRPESVDLTPISTPMPDGDFWTVYMNSLDCLLVDEEDLTENFDDMVNFGKAVKEGVCLKDPCSDGAFILVPKELAEKTLVLGDLP